MDKEPRFLALDEVTEIHADQIERYGGSPGIRDIGLLQSALAMPAATFGGEYLHPSIPEMAAAYLFHIVQNHPFVDGNKRVGLMAALVFLGFNDLRLVADHDELTDMVLGVASGSVNKSAAAVFIEQHVQLHTPRRR